ncbi:MAG TPA: hypothetical protein VD993_15955 [Chitinophagaceae bacterium]|nr:hypothetical protein [Chitinophagaceae bacterium]
MIKKLTAISLIALLVFNWYGYRVLMNYLEDKATTQLQVKLDKQQYDESSLITIRIPLNMPYITDWDDFESHYGETEIDGVHYKYVKRKVERGELVLLCIPNAEKTMISDAKDNFFKLVNDLQQPTGKKDSKGHTVKIPFSDYIADQPAGIKILASTHTSVHVNYHFFIPSAFIEVPAQPPEC